MQPILNIMGVSKRFGSVQALEAVSVSVAGGTVHCILGENGAGKSTLCNIVYGGYASDTGSMELAGNRYAPSSPADALSSGVAMVHQHFSLISTMTVRENLLLGSKESRIPPGSSMNGWSGWTPSITCASIRRRESRTCQSAPARRSRS